MQHGLNYHPSADQLALAESLVKPLSSLLPLSRLHESPIESKETWIQLEELGIFTISLSENAGGAGLGVTEEALIVLELGRHLAAPSVLATMGATPAAAGDETAPRRTTPAYQPGDKMVVLADSMADAILLRVGSKTALYPMIADSQPLATQPWLDTLHTTSDLPPPLAKLSAEANQRMTLIDAAALAGIAQRGLEMAVEYAKLREQFRRQIGSFQAIKHHCATMAIWAQRSRDQILFAAAAVDEGREDAMLQADCALLVAAQAATANAALNIQIHGGIGFSAEADPHLLVKRTQALIALTGGLEAANSRIAQWDGGARYTQAGVGRR